HTTSLCIKSISTCVHATSLFLSSLDYYKINLMICHFLFFLILENIFLNVFVWLLTGTSMFLNNTNWKEHNKKVIVIGQQHILKHQRKTTMFFPIIKTHIILCQKICKIEEAKKQTKKQKV
ncbi:hypothetical protein ACJX0J_031278, partial [Zea mays]